MQTNINSQPKKPSSLKKRLTKREKQEQEILNGTWWPFNRADPKILEKLYKQRINQLEEALL